MRDVTIVTLFADGADTPSVAVLNGHIPAADIPMHLGAFKGSAQVGVCHTQLQDVSSRSGGKMKNETAQIALANWRQNGDWTADGPSGG